MMSSVIFLGCPQLLDPYHCAQAGMALLVQAEVHLVMTHLLIHQL